MGTWGVRKAYRPALRVHAKLIKRDVHITEPSRIISPRPHAPPAGKLVAPEARNICQFGKTSRLLSGVRFGEHGTCFPLTIVGKHAP
jgi:hypothetical protein